MADEQLIKPRELPAATTVFANDAIMTDNGSVVGKATPVQIVNAGAPVPTEAEAIAGTDNSKRMTPLTVKQVLDNVTAPSVLRAQAWAESDSPPNPGIPGSMSAKAWAAEAERLGTEQADRAEVAAADAVNNAPFVVKDNATFRALPDLIVGARYVLKDGSGVFDVRDVGPGDFTQSGKYVTVVRGQGGGSADAYGADTTGVVSSSPAILKAIQKNLRSHLGKGNYLLSEKVGEIQLRQVQVTGEGADTTIHIDNTENIGFRLGAIGGNDSSGGARVISLLQDMNFTAPEKASGTPVRGIDAQSVNPINIERNRLYGLGPEAVTLRRLYYGSIRDTEFVGSGLRLQNVNNLLMQGGGFFGGATGLPSAATRFGSKHVIDLLNDETFRGPEGLLFQQVVFESWNTPLFLAELSNIVVFQSCWFEALTGAHIFKLKQTRQIVFRDTKFDLVNAGSGVLFSVDNSGPRTDAASLREGTRIILKGGELRLKPISGTNPKLATASNGERPLIEIDGTTLTRGDVYADPTVQFDVKGVRLSTDDAKSLYSQWLRARIEGPRNNWVRGTQSSDWDFAAGANFAQRPGTTGLTVATTDTAGEFLTGSRGVKVTGFAADGVARQVARNTGTNGDMGVVTQEGQTYVFFVRLKVDKEVTLRLGVQGTSLEHSRTPDHLVQPGEWRDYVLKTAAPETWAQNRLNNPQIVVTISNGTDGPATLLIDRIDYKVAYGDHDI